MDPPDLMQSQSTPPGEPRRESPSSHPNGHLNRHLSDDPSIVDLVFVAEPKGRWRRTAVGCGVVLSFYAGVFLLVNRLDGSLGPWGADLAARIHRAIAREQTIEMPPPPPPPAPPPPAPDLPRVATPRPRRVAPAEQARPSPPAQAGQLAAATPAPVDFTGTAFIVGSGSSYAGGITTSHGTSHKAVLTAVAPGKGGTGSHPARSRARPVSLDQSAWNCPWPVEADAQDINEQTVVLRAQVGPDGRADGVDVLADPGFGFGDAARLCALRTHFEPARGQDGRPIAAQSPAIRVHFFR